MRYLAFLRAINVGGHTVKMDRLRELFEGMGLNGVETFIASGNVIFETRTTDTAKLERKIETTLEKALGYDVTTFLRTTSELAALTTHPAFPDKAIAGAGAYCVGLLKAPLTKEQSKALMALKSDLDDFHIHGREVYWLCGVKQSDSKFNNNLFEKKVGVRATFRGISTLQKMTAKYPAAQAGNHTED